MGALSYNMYIFCCKLMNENFALIITVIFAIVVYIFMVFKLKILKKEDFRIFKFKKSRNMWINLAKEDKI